MWTLPPGGPHPGGSFPPGWEGTVRFVKVNIDDNPQLAKKYGVLSIPTIMLFEDGQAAARTMGARPANAIERDLGLDDGHASTAA